MWFQLRHLGRAGYRQLISRDIALAARLRRALARAADFEVLASGLSVVCFRHRPAGLTGPELDRHNQAVLRAVQLGGRAFLAGTQVDGHFALRACIVNPGMTGADVDAMISRHPHPGAGPSERYSRPTSECRPGGPARAVGADSETASQRWS